MISSISFIMQSIVSAIAKNNCCLMITLWSVPVTSAAYEDGIVFFSTDIGMVRFILRASEQIS